MAVSAVTAAQNSWQTTLREKSNISLVTFSHLVVLIVTCTKIKKKYFSQKYDFCSSSISSSLALNASVGMSNRRMVIVLCLK